MASSQCIESERRNDDRRQILALPRRKAERGMDMHDGRKGEIAAERWASFSSLSGLTRCLPRDGRHNRCVLTTSQRIVPYYDPTQRFHTEREYHERSMGSRKLE